jgi:hypothetical protein
VISSALHQIIPVGFTYGAAPPSPISHELKK